MNLPSLESIEVQAVSVAFVLPPKMNLPDKPVQPVQEDDVRKWLTPPLNVGHLPDGGLTIASMKDQKQIIIRPNRLDVRDLSGAIPTADGLRTLKRRSIGAISQSALQFFPALLTAYGLNYELTIPVVNGGAARFLAERLLDSRKTESWNLDLIGAGVKLLYLTGREGRKRVTLDLQPQPGAEAVEDVDAVVVNANVHEALGTGENRPNRDAIIAGLDAELAQEFEALINVLRML